jgi:hypothetical protein
MSKRGRGDGIGGGIARLEREIAATLQRRSPAEDRLAATACALASASDRVLDVLASVGKTLSKKKAFDRPLFVAALRALAERRDPRLDEVLVAPLAADDGGGLAALSAAGFSREAKLGPALARLATSRHPHVAFSAEIARVARRESVGASLVALAPKLKESYRISIASEVLLPLVQGPVLAPSVGPALAVLRDAERHLGRWLVIGEVAVRAGDPSPRLDAEARATAGPASARTGWTLVAWALSPGASPPPLRPSIDLVTRLSDRPSASRDLTFLFRLADARAAHVKPLLEGLVRTGELASEAAVRAALYLARDHDRADARAALTEAAASRTDGVRGLATAALFDAGDRAGAMTAVETAGDSKASSVHAWAELVSMAGAGAVTTPLVTEPTYRRLAMGWIE